MRLQKSNKKLMLLFPGSFYHWPGVCFDQAKWSYLKKRRQLLKRGLILNPEIYVYLEHRMVSFYVRYLKW